MFRCLTTSSSSSLSQICLKVRNSFAFVMVSGQLIYFHLEISKKLLIYLGHLRISSHPVKKALGVLLQELQKNRKPHGGWVSGWGGGVSQRVREPVTQGIYSETTREELSFLWPNLVQVSPLPTWTIANVETRYAPGSFTAGSVSLPWHLFIPYG